MSISARFEADFSQFSGAVRDAEIKLKSFEAGGAKVASQLSRMTEGFSGRSVIQDATLMAEAVERIGGTSKLTEAELRRVAATASEAVEKMRALGVEIPPAMQKLATATAQVPPGLQQITTAAGGTTTAIGSLHTGLSAADRTLAAFGVQLGPQVRALGELASASGKTAAQLGLVATAGLTAAAALGGWQLGRMIAEFGGLDEKIGNSAARLMGWGDAAAEVAGAKMDVLTRASKIAGTEITNFNEALKIINGENARFGDSMNTSAHRVGLWRAEITGVKSDGHLAALQKDLAAGHSTLTELSAQYGISTRALEFFGRENNTAGDAVKGNAEAMKTAKAAADAYAASVDKAAAALAKMYSDVNNVTGIAQMDAAAETMKRADANKEGERLMGIDAWQMGLKAREDAAKATAAAEAELQTMLGDGLLLVGEYAKAHTSAGHAATDAANQAVQGYAAVAQQVSISAGVITEWIELMKYSTAANAILKENTLFTSRSQLERISQLPTGGGGAGGGGGVVINNHINASDSFYDTPESVQKLARKVGDAVTAGLRSRGVQVG